MLDAELYRIAHVFNIGSVIKTRLRKIHLAKISLIFYINSKFFYNCLIKLGTFYKKCLMIDIMSFYQLYKRRKIIEVK